MVFNSLSSQQQGWSFDVSSLMILISEGEELRYRLSLRSLAQCIAASPVVGLQNYIRSYDLLLERGSLTYFSPYSRKEAPLRNLQLENAIRQEKLLADGRYTVFRIPPGSQSSSRTRTFRILLTSWIAGTWLYFGALVAFTILTPGTTWVGFTNCVAFTAWSILLRVVEFFNVKPAPVKESSVSNPDGPDAIFIMGRNNSAFVLEGSRKDIKDWTTRGLLYKDNAWGIPSQVWQGFTRMGSLLVLLLIFSTIPNGSTMDQLGFILLNALAQMNVLLGQRLNSKCCLARLKSLMDTQVDSRTHVYGMLLRNFKNISEKNNWVEDSGLLPKTNVWSKWKDQIVSDDEKDPKELYNEILNAYGA